MKNKLVIIAIIVFSLAQYASRVHGEQKKILYYRNPMNPQITSPVPMKDSMGMDYAAVYEEGKTERADSGVYISPKNQQLVGVKKELVQKRKLTRQVITVGKVAYDPDLYVAQQEYLQAQKTKEALQDAQVSIKEQMVSLQEAAEK